MRLGGEDGVDDGGEVGKVGRMVGLLVGVKQALEPDDAYCPPGQLVHADAPEVEYWPARHPDGQLLVAPASP